MGNRSTVETHDTIWNLNYLFVKYLLWTTFVKHTGQCGQFACFMSGSACHSLIEETTYFWQFQIFQFWGHYAALKSAGKISTGFMHCCAHSAVTLGFLGQCCSASVLQRRKPHWPSLIKVQAAAHFPVQINPPNDGLTYNETPGVWWASERRDKNSRHAQLSFSQESWHWARKSAHPSIGAPCPPFPLHSPSSVPFLTAPRPQVGQPPPPPQPPPSGADFPCPPSLLTDSPSTFKSNVKI